jgi:hypothetical protein
MEQFSRKRVIWKEGKRIIKRMNRGNGHLHGWAVKHYEKIWKEWSSQSSFIMYRNGK